jgi:hypothetical protein
MAKKNSDQILVCPRCGSIEMNADFECDDCDLKLPEASGLRWHFRLPEAAIADWKAQFLAYLHALDDEVSKLNAALAETSLATTKKRLDHLIQSKKAHAQEILELFKTLPLNYRDDSGEAAHAMLGEQIPLGQSLVGYYHNAHRDWAWGKTENEATFNFLVKSLGTNTPIGNVAILGAGAGRLAYDINENIDHKQVYLVDLNPLLLVIARRMFSGEQLNLHEFPIAPLSSAESAVATVLSSPTPAKGKQVFLTADALHPIFKPESLDTIITPWFVDIIPEPPSYLLDLINSQMKMGGRYICLGSLAFHFASPAWNLSPEEFAHALEASGFRILSTSEERIPYMQSPHSAHSRIENLRIVIAEKIFNRPCPKARSTQIAWIENPKLPVPEIFSGLATMHFIPLEILNAVDGKTSLEEIASKVLVKRYSMSDEDSLAALRNFFRAQASKVGIRG